MEEDAPMISFPPVFASFFPDHFEMRQLRSHHHDSVVIVLCEMTSVPSYYQTETRFSVLWDIPLLSKDLRQFGRTLWQETEAKPHRRFKDTWSARPMCMLVWKSWLFESNEVVAFWTLWHCYHFYCNVLSSQNKVIKIASKETSFQ